MKGNFEMSDDLLCRFKHDRKVAFEKFTYDSICSYCLKYEIPIPENNSTFWLGAHRARFHMTNVREDLRAKSAKWLEDNGFDVLF